MQSFEGSDQVSLRDNWRRGPEKRISQDVRCETGGRMEGLEVADCWCLDPRRSELD